MPTNSRAPALLALILAACSGSPKPMMTPDAGPSGPDPTRSTVTVDRATGVSADGLDHATITITLMDSNGNALPGVTPVVTATGTGNTISTPTQTNAQGESTATLASTDTGKKTISVTADNVALAQSPTVEFVAGPATKLAFTAQPSNAGAGATITPAIQVSVEDAAGRVVTSSTASITLALTGGPAGAMLNGTLTRAAVNGVATFDDLSLAEMGFAYYLGAKSNGLSSATSAAFNITAGGAAKLVFVQQPMSTFAGDRLAPTGVVVAFQDAQGNFLSTETDPVTIALQGTGTLLGTTTQSAVAGYATFPDLTINVAGANDVLVATSGSLSVTSSMFSITPNFPKNLVFMTQPTDAIIGTTITPPVTVGLIDMYGNPTTTATQNVTLVLGPGGGGGTLSGTLSVPAVEGIATFSDLSIDQPGAGYTLTASSFNCTSATSSAFNISAGNASMSMSTLSVSPTMLVADGVTAATITVTVADASGNPINLQSVKLGASGSGTFTPSSGLTDPSGVFTATFVSTVAETKTITATIGSFTLSQQITFIAGPPSATKSTFVAETTGLLAGQSTMLVVTVADAQGNVIQGENVRISATGSANSFSPAMGNTGANGLFTSTYTSTRAETKKLTATIGGFTLTAQVTFAAGPYSTAYSTFTATPGTQIADSMSIITLTLTAMDAYRNPLVGEIVALSAGGTGNSFMPAMGTIDTSGQFVATLSSSDVQTETVTATINEAQTATANVTFVPGPMATIVFTVQPSSIAAGSPIMPAPQVALEDAFHHVITTDSSTQVSVGILGGTSLSGTTTQTAVNGIATFPGLSVTKAGTGYTMLASSNAYATAMSNTFDVTPGARSRLFFSGQPTSTSPGATLSPPVVVTLVDAYGNTVTTDSSTPVTVSFATNPGSSTLGGTTMQTASSGVATFGDLTVSSVGSGYTLAAAAPGCTGVTSASFDITSAGKGSVGFSLEPGNVSAGQTFSVQVSLYDASNVLISSDSSTRVTLALGVNPGSSTLSGTLSQTVNAGVATFAGLSLNHLGTGYTLVATASGYATATSVSFNVGAAAMGNAVFSVEPSNTPSTVPITPAIQVTLQDILGNTITTDNNTLVTLSFGNNAGSGTLSGTLSQKASAGVVTFSGISVDKSANGYTLKANAAGYTATTSAPFNITSGAATGIAFTTQPSNSSAGVAIAPAVTVAIQDSLGNTATSNSSSMVTIALGGNPGGATLGGTLTKQVVNGVATFSDLTVNRTGNGYTLVATSGSFKTSSNAFIIQAGPKANAVFTTQPSNTLSGSQISPSITVTLEDALGNVVSDSTTMVTLAIETNPAGGALAGTVTQQANAGIAVFSGISISQPGTGYTLTATASGYATGTSSSFNITTGAPANAVITVQPANAAAGAVISPAVTVALKDSMGNTITSDSSTVVTVALGTNPGGGTLSGTVAQAAVNGVATFSNLSINKTGNGYTLTVTTSGGYAGATSNNFNIVPGAMGSAVITVQPTSTTAGTNLNPAVAVALQDTLGNLMTTDSSTMVTLSLGTNPANGALMGTAAVKASGGLVSFTGVSINRAATGYTLKVTASGYTGATSNAFNISPGPKAAAVFSVQPSNATAGAAISPAVVVTLQDVWGNTITTDSSTMVSVAFQANSTAATLGGTTTQQATAGVATFNNLTVNKNGTGYTLVITATGYSGATSNAFNVNIGAKGAAVFTEQPASIQAGGNLPPITVTLQDVAGNTYASDSSTPVALSLGNNPGGDTLNGVATVNAVNGVATFTGLSLMKAANGYTLVATATGYTSTTSNAFNVTATSTVTAVFTTQPSTVAAGSPISPAVVVTLEDTFGNIISSDSSTMVSVTPSSGTLSGTTTMQAVNGVATFSNLIVKQTAAGLTLTSVATGYSGTTSSPFGVTPGPKGPLVFSTGPTNTAAGVNIATMTVTLMDIYGNVETTDKTSSISVALGTDPTGASLSGMTSATAMSGVVTLGNVSCQKTGTGYTLVASGSGYTPVTSGAFNITPGSPAAVAFNVQPTGTTANTAISPAIVVQLQDAYGNIITTDSTTPVSLAFSMNGNPTGATLGGTTKVTASQGLATFSNISVSQAGTGYALEASATGYATNASSTMFNITAGAAAPLRSGLGVLSVETLAGNGTAGADDGTGGPNGTADFHQPGGVAVDGQGNVYVADTANNRIRVIDPSGNVTTWAGSGTAGATDAAGDNAQFNAPASVVGDSAGNLYVADSGNNTIRKIDAGRNVTTIAGAGAAFASPQAVTVDSTGNVYVADTGNNRICRIDSSGVVTTLATGFTRPTGVAVDAQGKVYVADTGSNLIRQIDPSGKVTTFAGDGTAGWSNGAGSSAELTAPAGLAFDSSGNLYVADMGNNLIRLIDPLANVTTLAGNGTAGFLDGVASAAELYRPSGLAVDSLGVVYIADTSNNRVREVVKQ